MKRFVFALSCAAATALACINISDSGGQLFFVVAPVLDSVFVGDRLPARNTFLIDANGQQRSAGTIVWSTTPESVATIDAVTGEILGVSKGLVFVIATRAADSVKTAAVVMVSRPLEMTLQLDTIYLMPNDTITIPVAIKQKTPGATTLQFDASPTPTVYTIDATTGVVSSHGTGGPDRYRVHLSDGVNTVSDSGVIVVMSPTDTLGSGKFFMTAFGTAIRHQSGGALALNFEKLNGDLAFRLVDSLTSDTLEERVVVALPDPVLGPGLRLEIDSIGPVELSAPPGTSRDPNCNPPRPWARWSSVPADPQRHPILTYAKGTSSSAVAGEIAITSSAPATGGGAIIGGRYLFRAQRLDLYGDPLGLETIRGTFVAPLRERHAICRG